MTTYTRADRAAILYAALHGWITGDQYIHLYNLTRGDTVDDLKTCTKCGEAKPTSAYSKNRRQSDGLQTWCKPCRAAYQAEWRARNRGRYAEEEAAWRAANAEHVAEYQARWREKRKGRLADYQRKYREEHKGQIAAYKAANRDRIAAQTRAYQDKNPHVVWAANYRRRARRLGLAAHVEEFTKSDVIERYGSSCVYCETGEFEHLDHYVSVKNGGPHTLDNVRPSCAACNLAKGDRQDYPINAAKENVVNTYTTITPRAGDIGEEETEWEVLPTHQPVETPEPAPSEPVPA